ncbi:DNA primase [Magnetococcus sp. PR-3]|uniref:DNA primase n=1 Tax=Magnetococcus sp. PR-3 TaxID=3120355 RepID=UPI002FCDF5EE
MAYFPDSYLDQLKERVDIIDVVERQLPLKKRGRNWLGLCPFHQEKTPSFNVNQEKGYYKCFGCGASGDAIKFLQQTRGMPFEEAIRELAAQSGLPLPERSKETPAQAQARDKRGKLRSLLEETKRFFQGQLKAPNGRMAREYLHRRGLTAETISSYELGFAPPGWRNLLDFFGGGDAAVEIMLDAGLLIKKDDGTVYDRFRNRVIFPILDSRGRCIAFGGRVLTDEKPKYINSPETALYNKSDVLYALSHAQERWSRGEMALVVEGYMDAVMLAEYGFSGTVATLGTAVTDQHLKRLWQRTNRLIFCFDGDTAGRRAAWRALERGLNGLQADRHMQFLFLPDGEDPDSLVQKEGVAKFKERAKRAISPMQLIHKVMGKQLDLYTPEGRAAAAHRIRPLISSVADPVLRQLYADDLGDKLGGLRGEQLLQGVAPNQMQAPTAPWQTSPSQPPWTPPPRSAPAPTQGAPEKRSWQPAFKKKQAWQKTGAPTLEQEVSTLRLGGETKGRDFEQVLIASALRSPVLLQENLEELDKAKLKSSQLYQLLTELLSVAPDLVELDHTDVFPIDQLSDRQSVLLAKRILREEETPLDDPVREFEGALKAVQSRQLEEEIVEAKARIRQNDRDTIDKDLQRLNFLLEERARLKQR